MLRTVGLEPTHFQRRVKLLFLHRLLPVAVHKITTSWNLAARDRKKWPRMTANLFYNMASGKMGLVGWGCHWL